MIGNGTTGTQVADGQEHIDASLVGREVKTPRRVIRGSRRRLRATRLLAFSLLGTLSCVGTAQAQAPVGLGTADSFAVLAASTVTNTGPSVVNGDLGVSPGNAVTGFPPGTVNNGTIHAGDAVAAQAQSDLTAGYNSAAGRACDVNLTGQDLGGLTLTTGVYCFSTSAQLTGDLTLNAQGNPNAVFIFQIGSMLTTASGSRVNLINGAQACNVFWQVGSSATLGTTTRFTGNILALQSITANTGATVNGRLLARSGAVTLDTNTITRARCAGPGGGGGEGGGGGGGGGGASTMIAGRRSISMAPPGTGSAATPSVEAVVTAAAVLTAPMATTATGAVSPRTSGCASGPETAPGSARCRSSLTASESSGPAASGSSCGSELSV